MSACGRCRTCSLVMLSRNPSALTSATADRGMNTVLRLSRCPSRSSTEVTRPLPASTTNPSTCPMSPSVACTRSPRYTSSSPGSLSGMTSTVTGSGIAPGVAGVAIGPGMTGPGLA